MLEFWFYAFTLVIGPAACIVAMLLLAVCKKHTTKAVKQEDVRRCPASDHLSIG